MILPDVRISKMTKRDIPESAGEPFSGHTQLIDQDYVYKPQLLKVGEDTDFLLDHIFVYLIILDFIWCSNFLLYYSTQLKSSPRLGEDYNCV